MTIQKVVKGFTLNRYHQFEKAVRVEVGGKDY